MTGSVIASLIVAAVAVLGSAGSVAMLGFRVGRLVGMVEGHIASSAADHARTHEDIGKINYRAERHIEIYHRGERNDG